jgi:hypothetical protein
MALLLYFQAILEDGDYENDWLTHLPEAMRTPVWLFGQFVAGADVTVRGHEVEWFWLARLLSFIRDLILSLI